MKEQERKLYRHIDEILFYLWDPIGVKDCPAARTEYQSYLPKVFDMLISERKAREIAEYLVKVETSSMGLGANPHQAFNVALTLIEAKDCYF